MKPLLIIRTGQVPAPIRGRLGDFPHWFRLGLNLPAHVLRVADVQAGEPLPPAHTLAAAVITGSAAMVTDRAEWSERTAGWIGEAFAAGLPLLGVCYGHQLMAHALGGRVGVLPGGREIGTQWVQVDETPADPLLGGLPPRFAAHTSHQQTVLEAPPDSRVLARSDADSHQIIRYGAQALSCQFHPEFSVAAMRAYIRLHARVLAAEGIDVDARLAATRAAPWPRRLLRRFAAPMRAALH